MNKGSKMVDVYLEAWPIGQFQAARKTFRYSMGAQIQIQVIGHVGGERSNHEIPGHGHHDPIPMGARLGPLLCSSGVSGTDPNSADIIEAIGGVEGQSYFGIRHIKNLAGEGGTTLDDVGHMTLLVQDYDDLKVIDKEWVEMFPDPSDRPARQVMKMGVQRQTRVQFHMIAAV